MYSGRICGQVELVGQLSQQLERESGLYWGWQSSV